MASVEILSDNLLCYTKEFSWTDKSVVTNADCVEICQSMKAIPPSVLVSRFTSCKTTLIAADRIRSIPVFYCLNGDKVFISDNTFDLLPYSSGIIDSDASIEFTLLGYTTGSTTLIPEIKQLQAGEYILVDQHGVQTGFYYRYLEFQENIIAGNNLEERLIRVIRDVFIRLIKELNGRTAVIPLSGGFDSRLIAYWLVKLRYPNIICFTYGRSNNLEVENARKTALLLKLEWHFIDYTELVTPDYLHSEIFQSYYPYMANHSSMFFMQDYFAVKYLKDKRAIPSNSVFVPGHSGDFLAGSHLNKSWCKNASKQRIALRIFQKNYSLAESSNFEKKMFIESIHNKLPSHYSPHLIYEDWQIIERQSKFIVNSARIYPFFGFDYFLPLWDLQLMDFFKTLPFHEKLYKKLYDTVLESLFAEFQLNFTSEIQAKPMDYALNRLKSYLTGRFRFIKKMKTLPKEDPICYNEITQHMVADLQKKNKSLRRVYTYNGFIVQWYISKIAP